MLVRVEVIKRLRLQEYNRIYNIKRIDNKMEYNRFIPGDTFDCGEEYCRYLMGETSESQVQKLVKVIEVRPWDLEEML